MRLPEFLRTATFRWTLTISAVFLTSALILVVIIYRESISTAKSRIDDSLVQEVRSVAGGNPKSVFAHIETRLSEDPRRLRLAGLFDERQQPIAGNMRAMPDNFTPDMRLWDIVAEREDDQGVELQSAHAVGAVLSDGNTYVIGRNFGDVAPLQDDVMNFVGMALPPAVVLTLVCAVVLSLRTQRRIEEIHRMAQRIMAGHLDERLPVRGTSDDFDKLIGIINIMLSQIERLMGEVKGVGDDIAHDLRTPLTRVRASLERGRDNAASLDDLRVAVDKGITGIDQALSVTTALLRIAAIEHGQRNSGFGEVDLGTIVSAVVDLYEPAADDKGVKLFSGGMTQLKLRGDGDLLFEAISNLVDNAIKFTPRGGTVSIELVRTDANLMLRVADTGPGIPLPEREAVFRRFYRTDKSRNLSGMGLGLSLVAAISRLHGFRVQIADSLQGCTIEMICSPTVV